MWSHWIYSPFCSYSPHCRGRDLNEPNNSTVTDRSRTLHQHHREATAAHILVVSDIISDIRSRCWKASSSSGCTSCSVECGEYSYSWRKLVPVRDLEQWCPNVHIPLYQEDEDRAVLPRRKRKPTWLAIECARLDRSQDSRTRQHPAPVVNSIHRRFWPLGASGF